jgi:hypothetical protein
VLAYGTSGIVYKGENIKILQIYRAADFGFNINIKNGAL